MGVVGGRVWGRGDRRQGGEKQEGRAEGGYESKRRCAGVCRRGTYGKRSKAEVGGGEGSKKDMGAEGGSKRTMEAARDRKT